MFCCLLNIVTALPARCCVHGIATHIHNNKTHSLTVIEYFFQDVLGLQDETGDDTDDFHPGVFSVEQRNTVEYSVPGLTGTVFLQGLYAVEALPMLEYNPGRFLLPPHHNFLFRLTPF